jgi:mannosyl-oligosaccharide alpha-1,2-mannosidase
MSRLLPMAVPAVLGPPRSTTAPEVWATRAEEVKNAFRHAYAGYQKHAAPHDELTPVSGGYRDR